MKVGRVIRDPAVWLSALAIGCPWISKVHATTWTNTTQTGTWSWSGASNWRSVATGTAPVSGSDTVINLAGTGSTAFTSQNNSVSTLHQLNLGSAAAEKNILTGNALTFVSNGGVLPSIQYNTGQRSPGRGFEIQNNVILNETTNIGGSFEGEVIFAGSVSGTGSVVFNSTDSPTWRFNGSYRVAGTTTFDDGSHVIFGPGAIVNMGTALNVRGETLGTIDVGNNSFSVKDYTQTSSTLTGAGTMDVSNKITWQGGAMGGTGTTNALGGVAFDGMPSDFRSLKRTLNLYGNSGVSGDILYSTTLNMDASGQLRIMQGATLKGDRLSITSSSSASQGLVRNSGTILVESGGSNESFNLSNTKMVNEGVIRIVNQGRLIISGGTFTQNAGGSITMENGSLELSGSPVLNGGSISGSGLIGVGSPGAVLTCGIRLAPIGTLRIDRKTTLTSTAELEFQLGGLSQGVLYSLLRIDEMISLDGNLRITFTNGFEQQITEDDTFTILTAQGGISGAFDNVESGSRLTTTDGAGSFLVTISGQNVVLSDFAAVPEPSVILLLGGGLAVFAIRRLRRPRVG